jgi:hypothetical protein
MQTQPNPEHLSYSTILMLISIQCTPTVYSHLFRLLTQRLPQLISVRPNPTIPPTCNWNLFRPITIRRYVAVLPTSQRRAIRRACPRILSTAQSLSYPQILLRARKRLPS